VLLKSQISGMIRTQMVKHNNSVMVAVYGTPCEMPPLNSNSNISNKTCHVIFCHFIIVCFLLFHDSWTDCYRVWPTLYSTILAVSLLLVCLDTFICSIKENLVHGIKIGEMLLCNHSQHLQLRLLMSTWRYMKYKQLWLAYRIVTCM
jgi:hypothetical protein